MVGKQVLDSFLKNQKLTDQIQLPDCLDLLKYLAICVL